MNSILNLVDESTDFSYKLQELFFAHTKHPNEDEDSQRKIQFNINENAKRKISRKKLLPNTYKESSRLKAMKKLAARELTSLECKDGFWIRLPKKVKHEGIPDFSSKTESMNQTLWTSQENLSSFDIIASTSTEISTNKFDCTKNRRGSMLPVLIEKKEEKKVFSTEIKKEKNLKSEKKANKRFPYFEPKKCFIQNDLMNNDQKYGERKKFYRYNNNHIALPIYERNFSKLEFWFSKME